MTGDEKCKKTMKNIKKRKTETNVPEDDNTCNEDEINGRVEMEKDSKKRRISESSDDTNASIHKDENLQDKNPKHDENFSGNADKKGKSIENNSVNLESKGKSIDVDLVHGKRFSKEEDEKIKQAVYNYIEKHKLGDEGLNMVLNCKMFPELKNCWKEIGQALPHRTYTSIYRRGHVLFETNRKGEWTKEEYDRIIEFQKQNGNNWKELAAELGKCRMHVKDMWRRIKLPNRKCGSWTQEEYQNLFELVNLDLKLKVTEEKKSRYGMLRDNIAWGAISDKLATRENSVCCRKWYGQLTSSMVSDGKWSDGDDYRLVDALFKLDACCVEDVDWNNLLSHRSGDLCKKRWDQMVLHIGEHGCKSFGEQVDILSKRYCPDLGDVRDAWDKKSIVP